MAVITYVIYGKKQASEVSDTFTIEDQHGNRAYELTLTNDGLRVVKKKPTNEQITVITKGGDKVVTIQ